MHLESVLDLADLLLVQMATIQKAEIPFQSNDLNVQKWFTPLFMSCISMSVFSIREYKLPPAPACERLRCIELSLSRLSPLI